MFTLKYYLRHLRPFLLECTINHQPFQSNYRTLTRQWTNGYIPFNLELIQILENVVPTAREENIFIEI
jgi:hypothetical protein